MAECNQLTPLSFEGLTHRHETTKRTFTKVGSKYEQVYVNKPSSIVSSVADLTDSMASGVFRILEGARVERRRREGRSAVGAEGSAPLSGCEV